MSILAPVSTSVYLYYDRHGILIYVGITSRGIKRNREHNETKDWWPFVTRQEVEHFDDRSAALDREKVLIETHCPPFNTQHNRAAAEVREAYLLFAAAHAQPMNLAAAVKAMQRRIDLDLHEFGKIDHLAFRTRVEDAAIVGAIQWPEGIEKPRVFGLKGKGHSKIFRWEMHGPIAVLHLATKRRVHPIAEAYANIKFDAQQRLILRNVQVRMDHSDRSACDKRCPPPPRPQIQWIRPDGAGAA